ALARLIAPDGAEVVRYARERLGRAGARPTAPSTASLVVQMVEQSSIEVYHSSDERTFAIIPHRAHREAWPLRSNRFRSWLSRTYYDAQGKAPGGQALADALAVLEGRALNDGPEVDTHARVAGHQGKVYLDLADEGWRAVEIDAAGWRVVSDAPV